MTHEETTTKLDRIKVTVPQIIANALDIAQRTEQLARLHATLRGNNQPEALVPSIIGMTPVEMSGETYLLAKRLEIKTAMEALASLTSAFWVDVEAISTNSQLSKSESREVVLPNIDFTSLLPPASAPSTIIPSVSSRDRPRVIPRSDKGPETKGEPNAA